MTSANRLLRMFAVAGAIVTAGVLMLAAPVLAQAGVPIANEVPGGTAPLLVLGSGLASTLGALVFMVRQISTGKLVPAHTSEREDKYLALLTDSSRRESQLTDIVARGVQREESYARLLESKRSS